MTHEKILICLIFSHFWAIFAHIPYFWNAHRPCQQYSISSFFLIFAVPYSAPPPFWFSGYNVLVSIYGNVHRPCRHYFIIVNNSLSQVYSFFPHFMAIFKSVAILGNVHRPYKQCINIIKRVYITSIVFLLLFPDLIIFAWITILGNVHRPCKQYTNIIENGLCHATPFFPDLFLMFWAHLHELPY